MFKKSRRQFATEATSQVLRCSFCNKSQDEVSKLIAGPSVFICDECVKVCNDIFTTQTSQSTNTEVAESADPPRNAASVQCALCRMPTPLDRGVVILNRGVLCPGCLGEIEAALAERSQQDS